jgi:hypothetical protein
MFHVFFSKISSYGSTLNFLYYSLANRNTAPLPPSPILSNTLLVEIDPCGISFAKMLSCARGFGDIVARGNHLQLGVWRSQGVKIDPPATKKLVTMMKFPSR